MAVVTNSGKDARIVLIVEDDDDSADLLARHLQRRNHDPLRTRTGEDAIRIMASSVVDLMILDLLLPGMSGWQLVETLRLETSATSCPIVVCSVIDRQDYPLNIDGVLPKPYTRRQVDQMLDRLLPHRG